MRSGSPDSPESPPPEKRAWGRLQFGLRGVLVAFAIGGLYLAWIVAGIERSPTAAIGLARVWYLGALGVLGVWFLGALGDAIDRRRGRHIGVAIGVLLWMTVVYLLDVATETVDATNRADGTTAAGPPLLGVHLVLALVTAGFVLGVIRRRPHETADSVTPCTTAQLVENQRQRRSDRNRAPRTALSGDESALHQETHES